jgi:uncharacterized protein (TIGR03437 family)
MKLRPAAFCLLGSLAAASAIYCASNGTQTRKQQITPAGNGPYRVEGNRILDSRGQSFVLRGTQMTAFDPETATADNRAGVTYGPHSATTLSAARLRFNLNAVRLPVDVRESGSPRFFDRLAATVRRANSLEMVVVIAAHQTGAELPDETTGKFWSRTAAYFKDYPNVMFDVLANPLPGAEAHSRAGWRRWRDAMTEAVTAIRAAGARQPVIAEAWSDARQFEGFDADQAIAESNVIYGASPRYVSMRNDGDRDAEFGALAAKLPVVVNGLDLEIANAQACAALPATPSGVEALVESNLRYFDERNISWTISSLEPGRLVKDLSLHDASTLENGWTCGQSTYQEAGLGRVIQGHMRASDERQLFVVSGAGGPDIARGAFALAYGPILANEDAKSPGWVPPVKLGGMKIEITDSKGATRLAGILWASAGWGQTNFVIPADSATGPAHMTIVRDDGSRNTTNITIAETAPGFETGHSCRGPAIGTATISYTDGHTLSKAISSCKGDDCRTIPVAMAAGATTRVKIMGSGFRNAQSAAKIEMTLGGVRLKVVSFGPAQGAGEDQVTVEIPAGLAGLGETDLLARINGRISNAVRLNLGRATAQAIRSTE